MSPRPAPARARSGREPSRTLAWTAWQAALGSGSAGARRLGVLVCVAAVLLSGFAAVARGQDQNFDQLSYHWYTTWALLHGQLFEDGAWANVQVLFNQSYNVPWYLLVAHLPARAAGFAIGALQGLNLVLVYLIAVRAGRCGLLSSALYVPAVAVVVAGTGAMVRSELGTSFGDNIVSLPLLVGVLLVLVSLERGHRPVTGLLLLAGAAAGVSAGLKLTYAAYVAAFLLIGPVLTMQGWRDAVRRTALLTTGVAVGFLVAALPWMIPLYQRFGNPVFPFYNGIFTSPWFAPVDYHDERWRAHSVGELVRYPFNSLQTTTRNSEVPYQDIRWGLLLVLAAVAGAVVLTRLARRRRAGGVLVAGSVGLQRAVFAGAFLVAYGLWLVLFGYQRYLVPLEYLYPMVAIGLVATLVPRQAPLSAPLAVLVVLTTAFASPGDWGHRPWQGPWFDIAVPAALEDPSAVLLDAGDDPLSYIVPSLPEDVEYIRVGYSPGENETAAEIQRRVARATGPLLLLVSGKTNPELLMRYGLRRTERCEPLRGGSVQYLQLCQVERVGSAAPGPTAR